MGVPCGNKQGLKSQVHRKLSKSKNKHVCVCVCNCKTNLFLGTQALHRGLDNTVSKLQHPQGAAK